MEQDSFYLFLPSNTLSNDESNPNTLSAYRTTLNKPLDLRQGSWEVGLAEASYPVNIYNVGEPIYVGIMRFTREVEKEKQPAFEVSLLSDKRLPKHYAYMHTGLASLAGVDESSIKDPSYMVLSEGNHSSIDDILSKVKSQLELLRAGKQRGLYSSYPTQPLPTVTISGKTKKVEVKIQKVTDEDKVTVFAPYFYPDHLMSHLLGFTKDSINSSLAKEIAEALFVFNPKIPLSSSIVTADDAPDINLGSNLICVYTDISQPVQVGNTAAPLLRSLPIISRKTDAVMHTDRFIVPYYVPLQQSFIRSIFVYITDEQGQRIKFGKPGRVQLVLHFRRQLDRPQPSLKI